MTKEELRGQMRAMRAELTGDKREAAEQQAVDHMMAFLRQKRPRRFYPFVSCRTEIDTLQLLQRGDIRAGWCGAGSGRRWSYVGAGACL